MIEHFTAVLFASRGADGAQRVRLDFKSVGAPRPLTPPERKKAARIALSGMGWHVYHIVEVMLRLEAPNGP